MLGLYDLPQPAVGRSLLPASQLIVAPDPIYDINSLQRGGFTSTVDNRVDSFAFQNPALEGGTGNYGLAPLPVICDNIPNMPGVQATDPFMAPIMTTPQQAALCVSQNTGIQGIFDTPFMANYGFVPNSSSQWATMGGLDNTMEVPTIINSTPASVGLDNLKTSPSWLTPDHSPTTLSFRYQPLFLK